MVIDKVRQFICGLDGHQMVRHFEPTRMSLKCTCGFETHGWDIRESTRPDTSAQYESHARELSGQHAREFSGQMCSAR